jgi:hypothetical protein
MENQPVPQPSAPVQPPTDAVKPTPLPRTVETPEQRQARQTGAIKAINDICKSYHVSLHVAKLDISSGRIWPEISIMALDLPS